MEGSEGSGSGTLLTESADISRRIWSNLLRTGSQRGSEGFNTTVLMFQLMLNFLLSEAEALQLIIFFLHVVNLPFVTQRLHFTECFQCFQQFNRVSLFS